MIDATCCICRRSGDCRDMGPWSVPKLGKDDDGIRWACGGTCSTELWRKVRIWLKQERENGRAITT